MLTLTHTPFAETFGIVINAEQQDLSELDQGAINSLLRNHHLIFFQDFKLNTEAFTRFTDQFSHKFIGYTGGAYSRQVINNNSTLLSVTGNDLHLVPAHGEMYYVDYRPDLLWFYCETPADQGGETTVFDAAQVYEELSEATKKLLHSKRLRYIRNYPNGFWQKIYQTDSLEDAELICHQSGLSFSANADQSITTEYIHSALVENPEEKNYLFLNNILPVLEIENMGLTYNLVRLEDGTEIPEEIKADMRTVTQRLAVPIPWKTGDIAMVDNTRLLHGRFPFKDDNRKIYVRMATFSPE